MRKVSFQSISSIWYLKLSLTIIPNKQILQVSSQGKVCRTSLFVSIVTLSIWSYSLFFQEILVGLCIRIQGIFKGFLIGSTEKFSENLQILVCLYLWFLCDVSPNDSYLMKLTHLSGDISESSEESSFSITDDPLNSPSFLLEFFYSEFVIRSTLIGYESTVNHIFANSILKCHDSYVSEVRGIYEKNNGSWSENLLWKHIGIESLLDRSFTDSILSSKFGICLFSDRIIPPENLILHT